MFFCVKIFLCFILRVLLCQGGEKCEALYILSVPSVAFVKLKRGKAAKTFAKNNKKSKLIDFRQNIMYNLSIKINVGEDEKW